MSAREPVAASGYDFARHEWVGQCPHGDVCTGCDALGYCTHMEPRIEGGEMATREMHARAMAKVDAMADFLAALESLGPHMEAVGKLCCVAVELQRWGTSMQLQIHSLKRDEYDSFEGEDRLFPPNDQRATPFWSKSVVVYEGSVAHDAEPRVEGGISLVLYTDEAPVREALVV